MAFNCSGALRWLPTNLFDRCKIHPNETGLLKITLLLIKQSDLFSLHGFCSLKLLSVVSILLFCLLHPLPALFPSVGGKQAAINEASRLKERSHAEKINKTKSLVRN